MFIFLRAVRFGMTFPATDGVCIFCARNTRGRDFGKPENALFPPSGSTERKPDEPEHGANPARSVHMQPKPARNKFRGLAAEVQARIQKGLILSFRGLFHVKHCRRESGAGSGAVRRVEREILRCGPFSMRA